MPHFNGYVISILDIGVSSKVAGLLNFQRLINPCDERPCGIGASSCHALSYGYHGDYVCYCEAGWTGNALLMYYESLLQQWLALNG